MISNKNYIINKNICWVKCKITQDDREKLHKHRGFVLWFTGLSGSGKTTLSNMLEQVLYTRLISTYLLDGDNIRHGLCRDLGFSSSDRHENIRRIGEVARLMVDAGLVVLASFISPYRSDRQILKNKFAIGQFIEIFVDTPLYICEKRDPKGLYKKVRSGIINDFTGINDVYEKPLFPDIYLNGQCSISDLIDIILNKISDYIRI